MRIRVSMHSLRLHAAFALIALFGASCSQESKIARHLRNADQSFTAGKYDEAEIGYKNVLRLESQNVRAITQLAIMYSDQGRVGQAIPFVLKARELQPEHLDLRIRFAQLSAALGATKDARTEAAYVLERRPADPDAPLILATTITRPQDVGAVEALLAAVSGDARDGAPVLTALGHIELGKGRLQEAETFFSQALKADTNFAMAHAGMASLYVRRQDAVKTEKWLRSAMDHAPLRSSLRLQYARYKYKTADGVAAKELLEELVRAAPDYVPARALLAEIALQEKQFADCANQLDQLATRDPTNPDAMQIRGRLQLAQGEPAKAVESFERLVGAYPKAGPAHLQLGLAQLTANDPGKAAMSFKQALVLAPSLAEASIALATVQLRTGDSRSASALLRPLLAKRPDLAQIRFLLAEVCRSQNNPAEALAIYEQLERDFPGNPQTPLLKGNILLQLKEPERAREAFNDALKRSPGALPVLDRLVALDAQEKKFDAASQRIAAELERNPGSTGLLVLQARICILQSNTPGAEAALKKAIELQPDSITAYYLLAQLYLASDSSQRALEKLQAGLGHSPKDVGAWMLMALVHEQQKDYARARDAYEQAISLNPRFASALNNVAVLYSERFTELDKALAAALKARELQPHEPHIADTLGWILCRRGQYRRALGLLEESVGKLRDSAEIQYHLGVAQYMLGDEHSARSNLQRSVELGGFQAVDDAKQRMAVLGFNPASADEEARTRLARRLQDFPTDPVALSREAELHERAGATDKAIAINLRASEANPEAAGPMINAARLHAATGATAKALEYAKAARKIEPDSPQIAHILGRIAYQADDFSWAASLLTDAARSLSGDPDVLFDAGEALYSTGRVGDAVESMQAAVEAAALSRSGETGQSGAAFTRLEQAQQFIAMAALALRPDPLAQPSVERLLKAQPTFVPAWMALGAIQELKGEPAAAEALYLRALVRFPDFTPAKARLAILRAAKPGFDEKAYGFAQQAREAYPNDHNVAKALGILTYRKGSDPRRAVTMLKLSTSARAADAEGLFYLGLAQLQAKDVNAARAALEKALALGLADAQADEARKALASTK